MMNLAQIKSATVVIGSVAALAAGGAVLVRHVVADTGDVHVHDASLAPAPAGAGKAGNQQAGQKQDQKKDEPNAAKSVLDRKVPQLNFNGAALSNAVEFLQDVSGQKLDWTAMEDAGIKGDAVVTANLKDATLAEAVRKVFESAGAKEPPSVTLENDKVVVKPAGKKKEDGKKEAEKKD